MHLLERLANTPLLLTLHFRTLTFLRLHIQFNLLLIVLFLFILVYRKRQVEIFDKFLYNLFIFFNQSNLFISSVFLDV